MCTALFYYTCVYIYSLLTTTVATIIVIIIIIIINIKYSSEKRILD